MECSLSESISTTDLNDREEVLSNANEFGILREGRGLAGSVNPTTVAGLAAADAATGASSVSAQATALGAEATTPHAVNSPAGARAAQVVAEAACGRELAQDACDLDWPNASTCGEDTKAGLATNLLPMVMGPAESGRRFEAPSLHEGAESTYRRFWGRDAIRSTCTPDVAGDGRGSPAGAGCSQKRS